MGILVGENTYRASAHAIEYEEQEPIVAKGTAEPVRVWRAIRICEATTRGRARAAARPLADREHAGASGARDDRRRSRRRQDAPADGACGTARGRGRGPLSRRLPLLRRGHHVLAGAA